MAVGIIGRKVGMTRVFTEEGKSVPVTVIEAASNKVTEMKAVDVVGYRAVQVSFGSKKRSKINKPATGQLSKHSIETSAGLVEYRLQEGEGEGLETGADIKVDMFSDGQKVDVTGTSIGKGYAGAIKRHNFSSQRMSHGNSISHRAPGSIGQCQTPGRVLKGKRMAGHMGNVRRTAQNLEVVRVDTERNLLLIKGAVPGSKGANVMIRPAVKVKREKQ